MLHPTSLFDDFYSPCHWMRAFILLYFLLTFFQMSGWSFEHALVAIQCPASIPYSILLSTDGIQLGDICFAKIQNTLHMRTVSIVVLERWIENGNFNLNHKAEGEYSRSTAILVVLNPNNQGTGLKCASVGLIVQRHDGQIGQIDDIPKLITYACSQLQEMGNPQITLTRHSAL